MFCYYCGKEISDDSDFCTFCGKAISGNNLQQQQVHNNQYDIVDQRKDAYLHKEKAEKDKNINVALLVCITVLVLIIGVLVAVLIINSGNSDSEDEKIAKPEQTPAATQRVSRTPKPTVRPSSKPEEAFERTTLYSSTYTYERMPDIHSSSPANDDEAFEMEELIRNFNDSWIEFINYSDMGVYQYLRAGTKPYGYAEDYEEKSLSQEYQLMDILDVRKTDDNYYVWTHEIINEYDYSTDKEKRLEYHWVYRIVYDSNGYYIADYISDPAYK